MPRMRFSPSQASAPTEQEMTLFEGLLSSVMRRMAIANDQRKERPAHLRLTDLS
jgi:hypothetical protein